MGAAIVSAAVMPLNQKAWPILQKRAAAKLHNHCYFKVMTLTGHILSPAKKKKTMTTVRVSTHRRVRCSTDAALFKHAAHESAARGGRTGLPMQSLAPTQNGVNIPGSKHSGLFGQDQYALLSQQLFSGQLQRGRRARESARCGHTSAEQHTHTHTPALDPPGLCVRCSLTFIILMPTSKKVDRPRAPRPHFLAFSHPPLASTFILK